jgi:uncharacterized membrane protein
MGFPFTVTIINIPQRFQIVNGLSPVNAGIQMLPLLLLSAVGAATTGAICSKKNIAFYFLVFSNILQILGTGLLSALPATEDIIASQYGIQIFLGFGFGMDLVSLIIVSRVEVDLEDHSTPRPSSPPPPTSLPVSLTPPPAVAMGAITQVRVLGGVVGLAIVHALLLASPASIASLPPDVARAARLAYASASNLQMRVMVGFAAASLLASLGAYRRHPVPIEDVARGRSARNRRDVRSEEGVGLEGGIRNGSS